MKYIEAKSCTRGSKESVRLLIKQIPLDRRIHTWASLEISREVIYLNTKSLPITAN
jgi:hypothetical protein